MTRPCALSPHTPLTFIAATAWARAAVQCGFRIEPLFEAAGIAQALRTQATPSIDVHTLMRLMRDCVHHTQAPEHFPLQAGECFAFAHLPALETFLTTSATPRDALSALPWVNAALPLLRLELIEGEDGLAVLQMHSLLDALAETMGDWAKRVSAHFIEMNAASIARFARTLLGEEARGKCLELQHDPGAALRQQFASRYEIEVRVGQARNAVVFARELLDRPLRGALPSLNLQARAQLAQLAPGAKEPQPLVQTLQAWLLQEPELLLAPLSEVAQRLRLHPRTLQRRLDAAGLPYAVLRDGCRQRLAEQIMGAPGAAPQLQALSERLGFSDRHSLSRAFKRWTGLTPSQWRQQRLGG